MHLALIADEDRVFHERAMLDRLADDLINLGAAVTRLYPQCYDDPYGTRADCISYSRKVLPWTRRARIVRLAEQIEKPNPDVIIGCGRQCWQLGRELADHFEAAMAVEVSRPEEIDAAAENYPSAEVAAHLAVTAPLEQSLKSRVGSESVRLTPLGVSLPDSPRRILTDTAEVSIAIVGESHDLDTWRNMLAGLSRVVTDYPHLQGFLELRPPNEHEIWRLVRRMNLESNLSALTDAAGHDRLLTKCDVLIVPESAGMARTIFLHAMASGLAVVARADPLLDIFSQKEIFYTIEDTSTDAWQSRISSILSDAEAARETGQRARKYVSEHNNGVFQARRLLEAGEWMLNRDAYPFPTTA